MTESKPDAPLTRPVWHRSLHWRLLAGHCAIVIPTMAVAILLIDHQIQTHLSEQALRTLSVETQLIADSLQSTQTRTTDWQGFAEKLVRDMGPDQAGETRITLIGANGAVLGDSGLMEADLSETKALLEQREIVEALSSGRGAEARYNSALKATLVYSASRIDNHNALSPAVVWLARRQSAGQPTVTKIHTMLFTAALLTFFSVLLAGFFTGRLISRPLADISAVSRRIARGGVPEKIDFSRRDELGILAASINELSTELTSRLSQTQADKTLLSTILDGMTEGVLVVNESGQIVLVNPVASELLEFDESVKGRSLLEMHRSPALKDAMDEAQASGKLVNREMVFRRGETTHLLVAASPLRQGKKSHGIVAVMHDITTLRQLERIRRDFVANVSHELRTPLATITGYAETLLGDAISLDPMATEFIETIQRHVKRLNLLVEDLLILARLEADGEQPRLGSVSISEAMVEVVDAVKMRARQHKIEINVDVHAAASQVKADRRSLIQVLRNLVENGIHYSDKDSPVCVITASRGDSVVISVTDSGIGIEPQHLPRIFERFYRVDPGRSRDIGGTGLGLAIVKHMVQAMEGEIEVNSTPGKGSTFQISLPKAEEQRSTLIKDNGRSNFHPRGD